MDYAMNNQETPRSIQDYLSIQQVGTETLVYDERRHKAFCLNETSSVIWRLANGERSVAQIGAAAQLELEAPIPEEVVLFAVDALRRDGLIDPSTSPVGVSTISRRLALQRLGVGGALLLPAIAAIVAPTAAQAYTSGCVDCGVGQSEAVKARAKRQQQQSGTSPDSGSSSGGSQ
jgi:phosphatidylserine decarboxylase